MAISHILIIGGGMCGLASAISIAKAFPASSSSSNLLLRITVFELRNSPSTIGGAVNLTPTALRCLDILGVLDVLKQRKVGCEVSGIELYSLHTASKLGYVDFCGPDGTGFGGYRGMRITRSDLLQALLAVVDKLDNTKVQILYGKKVIELRETPEMVEVSFEDGSIASGDLVLGCDGIHSNTRMKFVEPSRNPTYSGIAAAYGFAKTPEDEVPFFSAETGIATSRYGTLLASFADDDRHRIYLVALMQTKAQDSKEGWRALGEDQEAVQAEIIRRTNYPALPRIQGMVRSVPEWTLFPIYVLPLYGKWWTERVMLLGDAAHAMPPRGESIGYALEDAIVFSTVLSHFGLSTAPATIFAFYEKARRKDIEDAYRDAAASWQVRRDNGYIMTKIIEWLTPLYIWWTRKPMERRFLMDPRDIAFPSDLPGT